jgi:hypothetical protein
MKTANISIQCDFLTITTDGQTYRPSLNLAKQYTHSSTKFYEVPQTELLIQTVLMMNVKTNLTTLIVL